MTAPAAGDAPGATRFDRSGMVISPAPTEEEAAAIVAAIELVWPRPAPPAAPTPRQSTWRWSGRWWARPVPARRDRPWF